MINTVRTNSTRPRGNRIDPSVVRVPQKVTQGACLACASRSRVAQHTCGG